eukprot:TRINITY_DN4544_c0_g1_i2.p3 TRINITY_DN4544_c0_g1~~TRINITY_DN4544_c0_g1_i2.p3  ORF type:complete len:145 (-),score=43.86 TRINITY_DN4544_c0_g1_i2:378-812(-)
MDGWGGAKGWGGDAWGGKGKGWGGDDWGCFGKGGKGGWGGDSWNSWGPFAKGGKKGGKGGGKASESFQFTGDIAADVETFLGQFPDLAEEAQQKLREASPEVQKTVLTQGLRGARNPSGALIARVVTASGGGWSGGGGGWGKGW